MAVHFKRSQPPRRLAHTVEIPGGCQHLTLPPCDIPLPVVDEHVVHFEVGCLTGLVVVVAYEGVAQRVTSLVVTDDVARCHVAKPGGLEGGGAYVSS